MWEFECSEETTAPRTAVWALWCDPTRWPEFDPGVTWARVDGPFVAGAKVTLKPKGGPKSVVDIVTADPEHGFSTHTKLGPLATLRFEHIYEDAGEGKGRITSRIHVSGPLSPVVPRFFKLGPNEERMVVTLARLAEKEPDAPA